MWSLAIGEGSMTAEELAKDDQGGPLRAFFRNRFVRTRSFAAEQVSGAEGTEGDDESEGRREVRRELRGRGALWRDDARFALVHAHISSTPSPTPSCTRAPCVPCFSVMKTR